MYNLEGQMLSGYEVDGPVRITYGANWEEISRDVDTTSLRPRPYLLKTTQIVFWMNLYLHILGKQRFFRMSNMIMKTLVTTSSTTMKVA